MNSFLATQLQIPISQVLLLLTLSTLALVIGRLKFALLIHYCFTAYWVYVVPIDLSDHDKIFSLASVTLVNYGFGLVIVLLALVCIFTNEP
jgi:hypothetical protein